MKYPLTFYIDFCPGIARACQRGPFIFIKPEYKNDYGLYVHEWTHIKQAFKGLFIFHALWYLFSKQYKFNCEAEAFAEQSKHYTDDRIDKFAYVLATRYGLNITTQQAKEKIQSYL